jgi:hypothetical protein
MNERFRLRVVCPILWNSLTLRWSSSLHLLLWRPVSIFLWGCFCSASWGKPLFSVLITRYSNLFDLVYYIFLS